MKGLVVRNTGSWYTVQADDGRLYECKVKGNFRLKGIRSTSPVAVGDVVTIIPQPMVNAQSPSQSSGAAMVNGQCSMVNDQSPSQNPGAAMVNGQWSMVNAQSPSQNPGAAMVNGQWSMVNAQSPSQSLGAAMVNGQCSMVNAQSPSQNPGAAMVNGQWSMVNDQLPTALIDGIEDRRNYIIRRASNLSKQSHIIAANVDMAALIVTIAHPETSTTFIDRFLASAEAYRVPVLIIFNKTDLYGEEEMKRLEALVALYRSIGYLCLTCSAENGDGIDELQVELQGKTTLLSGNSGVGKSTLLNLLVPEACARTAEISAAHDAGMHTTTFSQMYFLPQGGALIDTPGIKGFGTFDMEREEVSHYFREIFRTSDGCRFGDCTHTHEPGCAVLKAVAEGSIAESRYLSFLSMLDDKDEDKYRGAN